MAKTLRNILAGIALAGGLAGCKLDKPETAVIALEKFYPATTKADGGLSDAGRDRWTALLNVNGKEGFVTAYGLKARVLDLKYSAGDTVKVRRAFINFYEVLGK